MEKRDPGRPKKKLREEDWRQKWYDAAESQSYSSVGVWEAYEAAIINYYTADENSRAPILPKQNSRNVHSGEKVRSTRIRTCLPEVFISADSTRIQNAETVFDIINRKSSGEPAKGRGNKKGVGLRLSYSQETEEQLVQWVLEMRDLHLPVSLVQVKEKARLMTQPQVSTFKASDGWVYKFFRRNHFTLKPKHHCRGCLLD